MIQMVRENLLTTMSRNLHSNSIIFFPARYTPPRGLPGPEPGYPQGLGYNEPVFVGLGSFDINLDYYQHPDRRRDPSMRYSRAFDIYSLGCLLLEIGYWKPLQLLVDIDMNADALRRQLQTLALKLDG